MRSGPVYIFATTTVHISQSIPNQIYMLFNLLRECLHEPPVRGRGDWAVHLAPPTLCLRLWLPPKHKNLNSQAQECQQQCHPPHCLNYLFLSNKPEQTSSDLPGFFPVLVITENPGHTPERSRLSRIGSLVFLSLSCFSARSPFGPRTPARPPGLSPLVALLTEPALPGGETAHVLHLPVLNRTFLTLQSEGPS